MSSFAKVAVLISGGGTNLQVSFHMRSSHLWFLLARMREALIELREQV